jgi:hypothetical protein
MMRLLQVLYKRVLSGLPGLLRRFAPRNDCHCERREAIRKVTILTKKFTPFMKQSQNV